MLFFFRLFLTLLISTVLLEAKPRIEIALQTTTGAPLKEAIVGEPFLVEVVVYELPRGYAEPVIEGADQFVLQRTGLYVSTINGQTKTRFTYLARADVPGEFYLGPVHLEQNGVLYGSEKIRLSVVSQAQAGTGQDRTIFFSLHAESEEAVVGEKINCCLKLYTKDARYGIERVLPPVCKDVTISALRAPREYTESVNNQLYQVYAWDCFIIPERAGVTVIPAAGVDYLLPTRAHALSFFSNRSIHRIYSNSVTLHVAPLPPTDRPVDGIGTFSSFTATLHPAVIKQGEGATISVILEGIGRVLRHERMLEKIPDGLKCYETTVHTDFADERIISKKFEYVLQGLIDGQYQIPAQQFFYFDVQAKEYKTVSTTPLDMSVLKNPLVAHIREKEGDQNKEPQLSSVAEAIEDKKEEKALLSFLSSDDEEFSIFAAAPIFQKSVSWSWFLLLCMCIITPFCISFLCKKFVFCARLQRGLYCVIFAFQVKRKLRQLKSCNNTSALYLLMLEVVALYYNTTPADAQRFCALIGGDGKPEAKNFAWDQFFEKISALRFSKRGDHQLDQAEHAVLFQAAEFWVDRLLYEPITLLLRGVKRISCVCLFFFSLHASDEHYAQAIAYYEKERCADALNRLLAIDESNQTVASLVLIGNCYYYLHDHAHARVYWERAFQFASYTQKRELVDRIRLLNSSQSSFFERMRGELSIVVSVLPRIAVQLLFLLLCFILLYRSVSRRSRILLCIILLGSGTILFIQYQACGASAIIVTDESLHAGPAENFPVLGSVHATERVFCEIVKDDWCKVNNNGVRGWVKRDALELIKTVV